MTIVSYSPPDPGKNFLSEELDQPLENSACLSNGRMVKILEGEIKIKEMELPLKVFEMKRDMHYNANIEQLLMGVIVVIGWSFLSQYLLPIYSHNYSLERNLEYCYEEFNISEITQPFSIIKYTGIAHLLKNVSNICSIQSHIRKQREQLKYTKEKVCVLIKRLNKLNPTEPLLASSLSTYASEIDFCLENWIDMIHDMSTHQILELRKPLGEKRFDSILSTRLYESILFLWKLRAEPLLDNYLAKLENSAKIS